MALLPPHVPGMRIGLFGGSFDPPHQGHVLVSRIALRRLRLHRIWWLVSPGNPLKDTKRLAPLERRLEAARALTRGDRRIVVTDLESRIRTRFTYDTLRFVRERGAGTRFVWIMGGDNLLQFDRWRHWEAIAALTPIAVIDRPGATLKAMNTKAAQRFSAARLDERDAPLLAEQCTPAFVYLHGPRMALSSTAIRSQRAFD
jgi:nicotinate-nucleotide adenylyltransferase